MVSQDTFLIVSALVIMVIAAWSAAVLSAIKSLDGKIENLARAVGWTSLPKKKDDDRDDADWWKEGDGIEEIS